MPPQKKKKTPSNATLRRCRNARSLQTCRKYVFHSSDASLRAGKLTKKDMKKKRNSNRIVSRRKSDLATKQYASPQSGLRRWNECARRCFQNFDNDDDFDNDDFDNDDDNMSVASGSTYVAQPPASTRPARTSKTKASEAWKSLVPKSKK